MRDGFVKIAAAAPAIRVADPEYNARTIAEEMREAARRGARILALPELCLTGYTCGDLFLHDTLLHAALAGLGGVLEASRGLDMLTFVGLPLQREGKIYNCAAAVCDGALLGVVPKVHIPDCGGAYEKRWFAPGEMDAPAAAVTLCGQTAPFGPRLLFEHSQMPALKVACEIGEDLSVPVSPSASHAMAGATVIANPAADEEAVGKNRYRNELVRTQSAKLTCCYLYAGAGEGESTQDAVFAGRKLICENGLLLARGAEESTLIASETDVLRLQHDRRRAGSGGDGAGYTRISWGKRLVETGLTRPIDRLPFVGEGGDETARRCEEVLRIQCLGLKKRLEHTGVKKLLVGVSGGLDSTLAMLVCARTLKLLGRDPADLIAVTMPCFGTTKRTRSNAELLAKELGAELRVVNIAGSVRQHFADIGHDPENCDVVYENSQARERTQVLMDIANGVNGLVVGTGDLSELALGWATYNGDHMSMYGVNAGVPKTLIRHLVLHAAQTSESETLRQVLISIGETPVSPELLPAKDGEISQKTEDLVGPYELHDFFLYHMVRWGCGPRKILRLARYAFRGEYDDEVILQWLRTFVRRFFSQQFKRSCMPDGPGVGSVGLSPRSSWRMPSDASALAWQRELEEL